MKTLSAGALTELAKTHGIEPINLIGIEWTPNSVTFYADKTVEGAPGKILTLGELDAVVKADGGQSGSIEVVLDDTDSSIKTIFDTVDVHKVRCTVYQAFGADVPKFTIFRGRLNTPFVWSEGERTVKFSIVSEIEDKEVGFSPEEAQFNFVSPDAVGKPWPLCFGHVVHVPATKVKQNVTGALKQQLCIADSLLVNKLNSLKQAYSQEMMVASFFKTTAERANYIAPPAALLLNQYIVAVKAADAVLLQLEEAMSVVNEIRNNYDLYDHNLVNADDGMTTYQRHMSEAQGRVDALTEQLMSVAEAKENLERQVYTAQYEYKVKTEARKKQLEAINNAYQILADYMMTQETLCRQLKCQLSQFSVENGKHFPQNTRQDLFISGTRWVGTFSGDLFTVSDGPLPLYENVELDNRELALSSCFVTQGQEALDLFWIKNASQILQNMYCLVEDWNGQKHIIKVTEQNGRQCKFDLQSKDDHENVNRSGANRIYSKYDFPFYNGELGGVPPGYSDIQHMNPDAWNQPQQALLDSVAAQLGVTSLNEEELETIYKLQAMAAKDVDHNAFLVSFPSVEDSLWVTGPRIKSILAVAGIPLADWFSDGTIPWEEIPESLFWAVSPGATVADATDPSEVYIANILPSTIHAVYAYRNIDSKRVLMPVPTTYYAKNEAEVLSPSLTVTSLKFFNPLSSIPGEGWDDEIYVTLTSSVGPKVTDILTYLIQNYTDKTVDFTSFGNVATAFGDKYPANFALFERQNIVTQLSEIAWQARCSIYEVNGTYYLKYLSVEPDSVKTISADDIDHLSFNISISSTDDLVTKLVATWNTDYLPKSEPNKIVLRHNVAKYGTHEQTFDFYIYNDPNLVLKSATFWLIRLANTWKSVSFTTPMHLLQVDTLDCITLDSTYLTDSATKCLVEAAQYDSANNSIAFTLWTPVRAGERAAYQFAWPGSVASDLEFPLPNDLAGGNGLGIEVTGPVYGE